MLILLISTIWLAALVLAVAICQMAARGDRVVPASSQRSPRLLEEGPSWESTVSRKLQARRARPAAASSKATASEHVRGRSQKGLYVGP
jgi:hypothetical protein